MTSFGTLSSLIRALFALWALLLCLTNISSFLLAILKKRYLVSAIALILFLPVYFMWQAIFDFSLQGGVETVLFLCRVPWVWWLITFIALTVAAAFVLGYNIRYEKNYVTPGTIKIYLDKMPCGVCCWRANGQVLFSNICMNELCLALTGGPLLSGNHFYDAVADGILTIKDKKWRFSCREITIGGERLREMIASDITAEYTKTQTLEADKAELSRLNLELKEYTLGIDETVRRQEILQAKVNIHDEMNRLMLSTMIAESEDSATLDHIFSLWEQNALLLCMEAENSEETIARIDRLAQSLKIRLIRPELPEFMTEEQRSLFFSAAQEALANAAKHARATTMEISFEEKEDTLCCHFSNDGSMPEREVNFCGGLSNLRRMAEEQNAALSVAIKETFILTIVFPGKNKPIG